MIPAALLILNAVCATPNDLPGCTPTQGLHFYYATELGQPWSYLGESTVVEPDGRYCWYGPENVGSDIVFVIATSFYDFWESSTEHGIAYGDGYQPAPPCP